jgi:hypothetical protein
MSDPRDFERDPGLSGNRNESRRSGGGDNSSGWIIAAMVAVALLGLAAYSYRDTHVAATSTPATTSGQSTRAPVPTTPPAAPVAPAAPAPRSQ